MNRIDKIAEEANIEMIEYYEECLKSGEIDSWDDRATFGDKLGELMQSLDRLCNTHKLQKLWETTIYTLINTDRESDAVDFLTKSVSRFENIGTRFLLQSSIHAYEWKTACWLMRGAAEQKHPFTRFPVSRASIKDSEMIGKFNIITKKDLDELVRIFGSRVEIWRPGTVVRGIDLPYSI